MIVTLGDMSPRQARVHIGDGCVEWKHFLDDICDITDQTGTLRGRIGKVATILALTKLAFKYPNVCPNYKILRNKVTNMIRLSHKILSGPYLYQQE